MSHHATAAIRAVLLPTILSLVLVGCGSTDHAGASGGPGASGRTAPAASVTTLGSGNPGGGSSGPSARGSAGAASSSDPSASGGPTDGSGAGAGAIQDAFVSIVERVNPSVVVIETADGLGSGIVFDDKGDIVTNAHVAGTSTTFTVTSAEGRRLPGTLVGTFAPDDVAVIKVDGASLKPATFGDSSKLRVGDLVLAIGNPLGLQSSVTNGIVSATGRTVAEPGGASIPNMIQTSAPINPGNSGGALVDLAGEVVGIPTLAASDPQMGGAASGIGFAVSSNMATDIAKQLIQNGKVLNSHRAYLGVQLANSQASSGALVAAVQPGGPASTAGIRPGDSILAINSTTIDSPEALSDMLASFQPGTTVKVAVQGQDGTQRDVNVVLGSYPG